MVNVIVSQSLDVLALAEKLSGTDTDQLTLNDLVPAGYEFNHILCKSGRRCGGIGISIKFRLVITVSQRQRRCLLILKIRHVPLT